MNIALLSGSSRQRIAVPTRDQLCAVNYSFNSLWIDTPSYGRIPWWETLAWFPHPADRQAAYAAKRKNGDTHAILDLSGCYKALPEEFNQHGADYSQNLSALVTLAEEVLREGFLIDLRLAGDGEGAGPGYNDPMGMTYGYDWLMANLDRIMDAFAPLYRYIVWTPGYDGVFYGWEPSGEKIPAYARKIRQRFPDAVIGIEHNGHIPIGEGGDDYAPGGRMQDYDVIFFEGEPDNYHSSSSWQNVARMELNYRHPADQNDGDNTPPCYVRTPNPRGRWYHIIMEVLTYRHVRGRVSDEEYAHYYDYFKREMNCEFVCR